MGNQLPLRDIHLPDPVSWWPPATGWWIVLVFIILMIPAIRYLVKKIRQPVLKKSAQAEMDSVIENYNGHKNKLRLIQDLSVSFKRIGISYLTRDTIAGEYGINWYQQINKLVRQDQLSDMQIQLLSEAPYQKNPDLDERNIGSLIEQVQKWVKALPRHSARHSEVPYDV